MTSNVLDGLRDIHLPPTPFPWPALWLLVAVLVCVLVLARLHRRRSPLRKALRALDQLRRAHAIDGHGVALARGVSMVLRGYAQRRFPTADVDTMNPARWLEFLERHSYKGEFSGDTGALLATLPYRRGGEVDAPALLALARRWLKYNRP